MAEPVLITGCASGDFQSLDGVFLARLQPRRDGTLDGPAPTAIIIFHNNDIREIIFQRTRSEEHTSELQSLMHISCAVLGLKKKRMSNNPTSKNHTTKTI